MRRCPFLLNILEALEVVRLDGSSVRVEKLLLTPALVRAHGREEHTILTQRLQMIARAWKANASAFPGADLSILRELFGPEFLTVNYILDDLEIWEAE